MEKQATSTPQYLEMGGGSGSTSMGVLNNIHL